MKRLCTLPAGIIFLLTTGLPILALIVLIVIEIVLDVNSGDDYRAASEYIPIILMSSWLAGVLVLQIWGLSTSFQFTKKQRNGLFFSRAALVSGLVGLAVLFLLCYGFVEAFRTPLVKASESVGGFSNVGFFNRSPWVMPLIILSVWFLPRLFFFGFLARALTLVEGSKGWFPTMLLFVLWPVGVWFLQPRIREVVKGRKELLEVDHLIG